MSPVTAGRPGHEHVLNPNKGRGRICSLVCSSSSAGPWGANPLLVTWVGANSVPSAPLSCPLIILPCPLSSCPVPHHPVLSLPCPALLEELFNQTPEETAWWWQSRCGTAHPQFWAVLSCTSLEMSLPTPGTLLLPSVLLSIMIISCIKAKYSALFLLSSSCTVFSEIPESHTARKINQFLQCIYCHSCCLCVPVSE